MALFHQCLNHPYLFGNMAHGGGFRMGRQAIKGGTVPVEQIRPACGEFRQRNASLLRIPDSFVIHIRQIADMRGGHPPQFQDAAEDVLHHESAEIADVGRAVHRGSATVKAQCFSIHGRNGLGRSGAGIVKV